MSLHDRVLDILEGRIRMGAAKPKARPRKAAPKKAAPKKAGIKAGISAGKAKAAPKSKKAPKRVSASKKAAKTNPWIKHVKAYAKAHKVTYPEALTLAGPSYHR